jgi:hypothetical protein
MRTSKSIAFPTGSKSCTSPPQAAAASAARRGLVFTLAILAELHEDRTEREVYEQREIEQHLRLRLA